MDADERIRFLMQADAYPHPVDAVQLVETQVTPHSRQAGTVPLTVVCFDVAGARRGLIAGEGSAA